MHVHIVGNGLAGSGCWLRVKGLHKPLAAFMLKHIGLPLNALSRPDFDGLYIENLLRLVRDSSLGGIVILAQDQVYHDDGKLMEGAGSFYVPNEYVLNLAPDAYAKSYAHGFVPDVTRSSLGALTTTPPPDSLKTDAPK